MLRGNGIYSDIVPRVQAMASRARVHSAERRVCGPTCKVIVRRQRAATVPVLRSSRLANSRSLCHSSTLAPHYKMPTMDIALILRRWSRRTYPSRPSLTRDGPCSRCASTSRILYYSRYDLNRCLCMLAPLYTSYTLRCIMEHNLAQCSLTLPSPARPRRIPEACSR